MCTSWIRWSHPLGGVGREDKEGAKWRKLQKDSDTLEKQIGRDTAELKGKQLEKQKQNKELTDSDLTRMKKLEKDILDNSSRLSRMRADIQRTKHAEMQLLHLKETSPGRVR